MLKLCAVFALCITTISWGQNHEENFAAINTVEEAEEYAKGFREVFTGILHLEKDVFFFDKIDTSNMDSYNGTMHPQFGLRTKLIQDSMFNVVKVQIITLDFKDVSPETAEILVGQMKKLLDGGSSYWDVRKRFQHTSAKYSSSPKIAEEVAKDYVIPLNQMVAGTYHQWKNGDSMGLVIIEKEPHDVPGFFTLSYRDANSAGF